MPQARPFFVAAVLLTATAAAGCATTQKVRISCVPREVKVYVDGRELEGDEAKLRTDRAHKIYAKGPGYEPQLVVLEPEVDEDGRASFAEEELCVRVVPVGMGRELEVEIEAERAESKPR
jgi:outer membrane murein-binding lipoprotein Lpp